MNREEDEDGSMNRECMCEGRVGSGFLAEVAALHDEVERLRAIQKLDKEDRCLDCCAELAAAGPPGVGGEPSLICLYCESQEQLNEARAEVERLERIIYTHNCENSLNHDDWELSAEAYAIEERRRQKEGKK